jgi:hypothetical protein
MPLPNYFSQVLGAAVPLPAWGNAAGLNRVDTAYKGSIACPIRWFGERHPGALPHARAVSLTQQQRRFR